VSGPYSAPTIELMLMVSFIYGKGDKIRRLSFNSLMIITIFQSRMSNIFMVGYYGIRRVVFRNKQRTNHVELTG
jgi:hypothetical protein